MFIASSHLDTCFVSRKQVKVWQARYETNGRWWDVRYYLLPENIDAQQKYTYYHTVVLFSVLKFPFKQSWDLCSGLPFCLPREAQAEIPNVRIHVLIVELGSLAWEFTDLFMLAPVGFHVSFVSLHHRICFWRFHIDSETTIGLYKVVLRGARIEDDLTISTPEFGV